MQIKKFTKCFYLLIVYVYVCGMERTVTNIKIKTTVRDAGKKQAKDEGIRGGFSQYVETLLENDLKKKGVKLDALS